MTLLRPIFVRIPCATMILFSSVAIAVASATLSAGVAAWISSVEPCGRTDSAVDWGDAMSSTTSASITWVSCSLLLTRCTSRMPLWVETARAYLLAVKLEARGQTNSTQHSHLARAQASLRVGSDLALLALTQTQSGASQVFQDHPATEREPHAATFPWPG